CASPLAVTAGAITVEARRDDKSECASSPAAAARALTLLPPGRACPLAVPLSPPTSGFALLRSSAALPSRRGPSFDLTRTGSRTTRGRRPTLPGGRSLLPWGQIRQQLFQGHAQDPGQVHDRVEAGLPAVLLPVQEAPERHARAPGEFRLGQPRRLAQA